LNLVPESGSTIQREITEKASGYVVQLVSLSERKQEQAYNITRFLINAGYCAYTYRTLEKITVPGTGKRLHFQRVRVGPFRTATEAMNVGEEILFRFSGNRNFSSPYWITSPSPEEIGGNINDLGIQRVRPWVFQVVKDHRRGRVLDTLAQIREHVDFVYLNKEYFPLGGALYSVRIGYFSNEKQALAARFAKSAGLG